MPNPATRHSGAIQMEGAASADSGTMSNTDAQHQSCREAQQQAAGHRGLPFQQDLPASRRRPAATHR